jgi:cell division protease FtsH
MFHPAVLPRWFTPEVFQLSANFKSVLIWMVVGVVMILSWQFIFNTPDANLTEKDFTTFRQDMQARRIQKVTITGEELKGESIHGEKFKTFIPLDAAYDIANELNNNGVAVKIERSSGTSMLTMILLNGLPILIIIGFWIFMMRQMQNGGNKALMFGKSRAG